MKIAMRLVSTAFYGHLASLGLGLLYTQASNAQEAVLEEVTVTARRREETLQDTPIAVSAFGAEELRAARINNVSDLTSQVPGLTRREGRKSADLNIRGVGTRISGVNAEPGVGVYVDSIYIPRNDAQLVDVLNMESVQVLRGPQGTLFGKNTVGGAVLLTTRKPGIETVEGFVHADGGNLNRRKLRFNLSGPIVKDHFSAGILIDRAREDGYREDAVTGTDYGDIDRTSALAQFRLQTDELFTGDLMLFWGKVDENIAPKTCQLVNPGTLVQSFTAPGNAQPYQDLCNQSWALNDDEEVLMDTSPLRYEITNRIAGLTLAWDFNAFTFKSITGYLQQDDIQVADDVDASPLYTVGNVYQPRRQLAGNGIAADDEVRRFFSQEFQFIGAAFNNYLEYTVGAFLSREKIEDNAGGNMLGPGGFLGVPQPDGSVDVFTTDISFREAYVRDFENTSAALFGQFILNFSDMWQLTLGGRYTWEEKQVDQTNYRSTIGDSIGNLPREQFDALANAIQPIEVDPDNPNRSNKESWRVFSPSATLTMFTPDKWHSDGFNGGMLYGSVSNGFKAGGFAAFGDEFIPFDPENLWTTELGYKLEMWSSRVRLNGAFYYSKYDDIQINSTRNLYDPVNDIVITENGITNAGKATIYGTEVEFSILPVDGLFLGLTASYTKPRYDEWEDETQQGGTIDRSDEDFAFLPEQTYSLTAQYDWMTEVGNFVPRLNGYHISEVYIGLDPESADFDETTLDGYTIWNFRFAWQAASAAEGLEIAAYVNNLTDEAYFGTGTASVAGIGALSLTPGRQRTYGLEVYYSW